MEGAVEPEGETDPAAPRPALRRRDLTSLALAAMAAVPATRASLTEAHSWTNGMDELIRHTQMILHRSDKVREKFWSKADRSSVEKWLEIYATHAHRHARQIVEALGRATSGDSRAEGQ